MNVLSCPSEKYSLGGTLYDADLLQKKQALRGTAFPLFKLVSIFKTDPSRTSVLSGPEGTARSTAAGRGRTRVWLARYGG